MLSKKGEAAGEPLAKSGDLILGVLSVIVIVGVVVLLFSGDSIEELVCKISVHMADQTHGVLPIICRTFDQVVDESQTSRVKFEIADHMRRCWSMWGEGDLNPVGKNIFVGDEFKCYKCYRLQFPEYEGELSYNETRDYLEDPDVRVSRFNDNTYVNYFDNNVLFSFKDPGYFDSMIRKDQKYAVTFIEHVEKSTWVRAGAAAGIGATAVSSACVATGYGILALPGCALAGGVGGTIAYTAERIVDAVEEWYQGDRERDGVMFSRYEDVESYCGGYIE